MKRRVSGKKVVEINDIKKAIISCVATQYIFLCVCLFVCCVSSVFHADVEIMVYLGILDTRKVLGSQKILT